MTAAWRHGARAEGVRAQGGGGGSKGKDPVLQVKSSQGPPGDSAPTAQGKTLGQGRLRSGEACQSPPKAGQTGAGHLYRELGRGVRTSDLGQRMARVSQHPEGMCPRG